MGDVHFLRWSTSPFAFPPVPFCKSVRPQSLKCFFQCRVQLPEFCVPLFVFCGQLRLWLYGVYHPDQLRRRLFYVRKFAASHCRQDGAAKARAIRESFRPKFTRETYLQFWDRFCAGTVDRSSF